ncbi:unnamed protein product [Tenebrio molitor]|nr:unnamed protein product [Tenebrio molitor]
MATPMMQYTSCLRHNGRRTLGTIKSQIMFLLRRVIRQMSVVDRNHELNFARDDILSVFE